MNLDPMYTLIKKYEGLSLKPYICPAGVPTIGYGHTGKGITMSSAPITKAKAEELLEQDVQKFIGEVLRLSPHLNGTRLCAIADFCYNLGTTRYKASTLKKRIDIEDWEGAKEELVKWVWGGGRKLPGLILRRNEEALLLK